MADLTKRSIGQVVFRHTPGSLVALDEYGVYGQVTEVRGDPDSDVDKNTLFKKVKWFLNKWDEESNGKIRGFELSDLQRDSLVAIRPQRVLWEFIPQMLFECTDVNCKVVISCADGRFNGKCPRCKKSLRQFRYVWFHQCGNLRPMMPILQVKCPIHNRDFLYLYDTGRRFRTAYWKCRECNYERSIGMLQCSEPTCTGKPDSYLRASVWNDPWVYFPQVITFVNLKDEDIKPVIESPIKEELFISSYLGLISAGKDEIKKKAENSTINKNCISCGRQIDFDSIYCKYCNAKQPDVVSDPKTTYKELSPTIFSEDSELVTYVALRDLERTLSFREERGKLKDNEDLEKRAYYDEALNSINKIGLSDILLIGDFPLTYSAVGYTRFQSKPQVWLRAFPPARSTGTKIPIYTNCITTEALMFQLSASFILKWLKVNNLIPESLANEKLDSLDEANAKLWLLELLNDELETDEEKLSLKTIIKELIHSMSHVFLQSVSIESGMDIASFGELLLPNTLSFIIYAGESDVGGVTATFNQGLRSLLAAVSDQLRSCKFDPSCSEDDDGACVGCLQLPRGCVEFNERLSRAYIFGGKTKKLAAKDMGVGYFDLTSV